VGTTALPSSIVLGSFRGICAGMGFSLSVGSSARQFGWLGSYCSVDTGISHILPLVLLPHNGNRKQQAIENWESQLLPHILSGSRGARTAQLE
jgi:hypothetical protein